MRCNYCQVDVSLLGSAKQQAAIPQPVDPVPPAAPGLAGKSMLPLLVGVFGLLAPPTVFFLDRNDNTNRTVIMAVIGSIAGFVLYGTGRRYLGAGFSLALGLVLALKPFVRPVVYDGRPMSLNSETHYYFLIPGFLMLAVFGWLLLLAIEARNTATPSTDGKALRIVTGIAFCAGMFVSNVVYGGPTTAEVLVQYAPQGMAKRGMWQQMASKLPAPGAFEVREKKLVPGPVWIEGRSDEQNIEIVHASQLADPDTNMSYGNLYLSGELSNALVWTGPKNPLSSTLRGEPGGSFGNRLAKAFGMPWIAVYRDGKQGIEIFVFDAKAGEIVVATTVAGGTGNYTTARESVIKALAKATGGTFRGR